MRHVSVMSISVLSILLDYIRLPCLKHLYLCCSSLICVSALYEAAVTHMLTVVDINSTQTHLMNSFVVGLVGFFPFET